MLPIYIICHANCEPSAYLCHYFHKRNIIYNKINATDTKISTLDLSKVGALIFMGGPYSVNDKLPWLADELEFIHRAIEKNILIMGVCFGAQLISKALNAEVVEAENMELGWHNVTVDTSQISEMHTLNLDSTIEVFEWHEDIYSMPEGAIPIFSSHTMANQGYIYGNVFAMQFHLEVTEYMINEWLERYKDYLPEPSLTVQSSEQINENISVKLDKLHATADIIYDWWLNIKV